MKLSKNKNMNTVVAYSNCAGSTCWCSTNCTNSSNNQTLNSNITAIVVANGR